MAEGEIDKPLRDKLALALLIVVKDPETTGRRSIQIAGSDWIEILSADWFHHDASYLIHARTEHGTVTFSMLDLTAVRET